MARPNRALNYYGSKVQSAHRYPAPQFKTVIEPFAGGAGYSLLHREHDVILFDLNPDVIGAWRYLIETPGSEIMRLPLLQPGDAVPLDLPEGARLLIGWSVMMCGARPQRTLVPAAARVPSSFWGESRRAGLAQIADTIKHWRAFLLGYSDLCNALDVTWFVDPPYQGNAGSHYVHGSNLIDYYDLAAWCTSRAGQVIVCEGPDATWLPFEAHHEHASAPTSDVKGRRVSTEVIWTR